MRKGTARRLYDREWRRYQDGYIDGAGVKDGSPRYHSLLNRHGDDNPAYSAGFDLGKTGSPCPRRLPLDIWSRCFALAHRPVRRPFVD